MPSLLSNLKSAREYITPTLKSTAFLSRGVLTPEEFVAAGDELVFKCPTWSWEAGDPSKRKKHLPKDKQYLITRNVPCAARVSSLENVVAIENNEPGGCDGHDDGDWLVSQILTAEEQKARAERMLEDEFDILDDEGETMVTSGGGGGGGVGSTSSGIEKEVAKMSLSTDKQLGEGEPSTSGASDSKNVADGEEEEDDEYADMADFEDDNVMEDEAAVTNATTSTLPSINSESNNDTDNNNVLKVRSYDVSITYDKYYQTPRVWLMGYTDDGSNTPLTGDEMMEDVISDYAHRTVTVENHPHVSGPHASIHPCQHGAVMKTIVKNLTIDGGNDDGSTNKGPSVEMYLFIFLKFVSSMIPTISYDFTMDVSASTKK